MQKIAPRFFVLLLTVAFIVFGATDTVAQKQRKKKTFHKKEIKKDKEIVANPEMDTVKKDNTDLAQKEVIIDSLLVEKGTFKLYKDKVHVSYYANRFHGKKTASGKRFDMNKMTAAHKKLPFGTIVRITNEANGKSVVVEIIDRGPFVKGREIDLSKRAFFAIASGNGGYIIGRMEVLQK